MKRTPPLPGSPPATARAAWSRFIRSRRAWRLFPITQGVIILLVVFALPKDLYLSSPSTDLVSYFISARAFAAESLRAGHLPLWDPYAYGGQPFLGGFQSALLYPPTLLFLVLPLDRAMNLSLLGHLVLLGWGMQFWAARRGLHPLAAGLAGLAAEFSGPIFPRLFAGHLSNLCTMAWVPWLFACLELWRRNRSRPALVGAAASVGLQILGGHVQYVFYTGIAVGLWSLLYLLRAPKRRWTELPVIAGVYAAGALLAAAQLLPGFDAASEGVRSGKLDYSFATMFSFAPENVLTMIAPGFFGDLTRHPYWGRCYLWEMSVFVGAAGVVLIIVGTGDPLTRRRVRWELILVALLALLALGDHTPLYRVLYDAAPGFAHFRGISKFTFQAMLFLILALATGASALLRGRLPARRAMVITAGVGGVLVLAGVVTSAAPGLLSGLPLAIKATQESYLQPAVYERDLFRWEAAAQAAWTLVSAGGLLLLAAGSLWLAPRLPRARWVPLALLPLEWIAYARGHLETARLSSAQPPELKRFFEAHPGDYRVLNLFQPNNGFLLSSADLWGNDPNLLRRYAEFITASQGGDLAAVSQYVNFTSLPPVYAMLRFRFAVTPSPEGAKMIESARPMERVQLLSEVALEKDRDALFKALLAPGFDPRRTVYLETPPDPWPKASSNPGTARVVGMTSDTLDVEADLTEPALLLNTDLYSKSWRVRALPGSAQSTYQLLPANYILRGVPLEAGHHRLRFEYRPALLGTGYALSGGAWVTLLGAAVACRRRSKR